MDSLPFVVPIAAAVFLANACWSFSLGCQVRHLRRRVEAVEERHQTQTQIQIQQRPTPVAVTVPAPAYYPGPMYQHPHTNSLPTHHNSLPTHHNSLPPPYRSLASAPPSSFQNV